MKDDDISSPMELEAALLSNDMRRREKLWRQAEGRSLSKIHLFGLLGSYAVAGIGLVRLLADGDSDAAALAAGGAVLVVGFVYRFQQRQIDALLKIVREMSPREG